MYIDYYVYIYIYIHIYVQTAYCQEIANISWCVDTIQKSPLVNSEFCAAKESPVPKFRGNSPMLSR